MGEEEEVVAVPATGNVLFPVVVTIISLGEIAAIVAMNRSLKELIVSNYLILQII